MAEQNRVMLYTVDNTGKYGTKEITELATKAGYVKSYGREFPCLANSQNIMLMFARMVANECANICLDDENEKQIRNKIAHEIRRAFNIS